MITFERYERGTSEKLDGFIRNQTAWIVQEDKRKPDILVADTAADALIAYAQLMKAREGLPPKAVKPKIGRPPNKVQAAYRVPEAL